MLGLLRKALLILLDLLGFFGDFEKACFCYFTASALYIGGIAFAVYSVMIFVFRSCVVMWLYFESGMLPPQDFLLVPESG